MAGNKCISRTDTNPPFAFQIAFPRGTDFTGFLQGGPKVRKNFKFLTISSLYVPYILATTTRSVYNLLNPVTSVLRGKAIWNANGGFVSVLLTHLFFFHFIYLIFYLLFYHIHPLSYLAASLLL